MDTAFWQELFQQWGHLTYLIIVGWTFIEGETCVILAGVAASALGTLHPWLIALCAFAGSFCSDQLMFFLGKHFGPAIFKKFPRLEKNTDKVRDLMLRHETMLILGFRFVYGVRNITPIMLGMSGVSHFKFFCLNLIGAMVWAFSFAYGGYYLGEAFTAAMANFKHGALAVVGILILLFVVFWWIRRKRDKADIDNAEAVARAGLGHDPAADANAEIAAPAQPAGQNAAQQAVKPGSHE